MRKTLLFSLIILSVSNLLFAGAGTDSLSFLKIQPSARGAAIGDGFVAIADDVNAVFYNPAGLSQLYDMEFSLMHMAYIADTSYEYAAFAMPVGDDLRIGAYVVYFNYGSIGITTEDSGGNYQAATSTYNPNDFAVNLSGSYRLQENLSIGVNVKYATESVDTMNITGVMADAGVLANIDAVRVGATLYNLGSVSLDKAPIGARVGGSTKFTAMEADDLTVAAGANYTFADSKLSESIGGEFSYEHFVILRSSYSLMTDANSLNLGVGLRQSLGGFIGEVAYGFSLFGDLGSTHRISVGIKLGDDNGKYKAKKKTISKSNSSSSKKPAIKYYFKIN